MNYMDINTLIEDSKYVTIFRHKSPDGDAVFSQCALRQFFIDNFPDKIVKICGEETYSLLPEVDDVSDEFIEKSLAIVLDTANAARVDDQRYLLANATIKIDHHPAIENFCDFNFVNDKAAATAEYLAEIFFSPRFKNYKVSKKTAKYLFCGILTDTINFKTTSTSTKTLAIAAKLADIGLNISDLVEFVFSTDYESFNKVSVLRTKFKIEEKFGYCLLEQNDLNDLGMTCQEAKNSVAEFAQIKDVNVYCVFAYNKDQNCYEGSLRSKKGFIINTTAQKYGGGGHANASGVKYLNSEKLKCLMNDLLIISRENS